MIFCHIYIPFSFIYGGNQPFSQLNHFNVSVTTLPVVKEYQDTVKSVESLTSFHALKESVKILLEVVFSHLCFLQVEDIPLNTLISHLPPVTVITFLDLVPHGELMKLCFESGSFGINEI